MSTKILAGAAALALVAVAAAAVAASARNWQGNRGNGTEDTRVLPAADMVGGASAKESPSLAMGYYYNGHYPGYAYVPGYNYAPSYGYGAHDWSSRSYRGGSYPR
jgi:hypothetical protein